jgi:hypothetical protein
VKIEIGELALMLAFWRGLKQRSSPFEKLTVAGWHIHPWGAN